jgi:hypothetical protein
MRLAVTFLILAIFVPAAAGMIDDFKMESSASAAKAEADRIADAAKKVYYSGSGSNSRLDVSLPQGSCLVVGGDGSDSYCITIQIDDNDIEKLYLQRPSVRFFGEPLFINGSMEVSLRCVVSEGAYGIEVEAVD